MRDNWTEATLGEVATWSTGKNLSASKRSSAGAHPILGANGLIGRTNEVLLDCDLITVGRVGACGETHRSAGPVWVSDNALIAIPNNRVLIDYLYHVLSAFEYQTITSGTTQPLITQNKLKNQVIQLPPLAEQNRIVDVAASVDAYIAALQQQADQARTARNAVLHELLTAGGDDWTETTLGELVNIQKGKKPPRLGDNTTTGQPYLTADVLRGSAPSQFVPQSALAACVQLQGNETILLWDGAGAGDVFRSTGGVLASTMAKLAIKQIGLIGADYLYLVVVNASPQIKSSCRGTTVPHVSPGALTALSLTLPPLSEQQRIVGIVSAMDDVVSATEKAVSNADGLRTGLMSDLLSGDHEIPESYDRLLGAA